nr:hypothetical protein CFP56_07285 [Quercus suber]
MLPFIGRFEMASSILVMNQVQCFKLSITSTWNTSMQWSTHRILLNPQHRNFLTPPPVECRSGLVHMANPFRTLPMKILVWNCRGMSSQNFRRSFADLSRVYRPDIVVIMETRISGQRAEDVNSSLGFNSVRRFDATGFRGGIWVFWNDNNVTLDILSMIDQAINAFF